MTASTRGTGFALTTPCGACPFRSDKPFALRPGRAREFAEMLHAGGAFHCHKTVDFDSDDEGDSIQVPRDNTNWCAGALITMEKGREPNQQVRLAERLGLYDPTVLDMDAPVYDSLSAWVRSYAPTPTVEVDGDLVEYQTCSVVGDECENPAGIMSGGGIIESDPQCHPVDDACYYCGEPACDACANTDPDGHRCCLDCDEERERLGA